jgi:hypothetical protein
VGKERIALKRCEFPGDFSGAGKSAVGGHGKIRSQQPQRMKIDASDRESQGELNAPLSKSN